MSTNQLFIPNKIKVGFQNREGTYTGKLAYVIYFDKSGKLRKEKSWNSWIDEKIDTIELDNVPTEGFVLNKGVGGQRQSYGWNARNEYIRVYDPRDFEFEISVANLLFILRECDCSRGKGLEGKFIYSWDGTELVLLPINSLEYKNSLEFTELKDKKVRAKDLIEGATYITKKQKELTYIGRFDYYFIVYPNCYNFNKKYENGVNHKKYIFWDGNKFVPLDGLQTIAVLKSDTVIPNFAEIVDQYYKSPFGSKAVELFLKERDSINDKTWFFQETSDVYVRCRSYSSFIDNQVERIECIGNYRFDSNGLLIKNNDTRVAFPPGKEKKWNHYSFYNRSNKILMNWVEPTNCSLIVRLESGAEFEISRIPINDGRGY